MRPKVKYHVIYRNRERYPISVMCRFFEVSRSGYDDFVHRLERKKKDEGEGCRFGGSYPRSARALLQDIWISTDVAVAEETRHAPQSQDSSANHEEIRPFGRNSPPEKMGSGGPTTAQI